MKKKLIASIFSLVMAFVLMTSASFAWFTVSTAPDVTKIDVKMQAVNNLEIGIGESAPSEVGVEDGENLNKWGNSVNYKTFDDDAVVLETMATVSSNAVKTVTYGETGRTAGLEAATILDDNKGTDVGTAAVSVETGATPSIYTSTAGKKCAVEYSVWLRSNTYTTVEATVIDATWANFSVYVDGQAITSDTGSKATITLPLKSGSTNEYVKQVKIVVLVDGTSKYAKDAVTATNFKGTVHFAGVTA